jgi:hypothetical protein
MPETPGRSAVPELRASDVARILGIHRSSVHRIPRDQLPYAEIGRRRARRYRDGDVEAYAEQTTQVDQQTLIASIASRVTACEVRLDEHAVRLTALEERS